MGAASERHLYAADDDRHVAVCLAYAVAVYNDRAVGAVPHFAAGRIVVVGALFLCRSIVADHGIYIAAGHKKAELRSAEALERLAAFVVRLRQHRHKKAVCLKHTAYKGCTEGRMVHIGVAADIYEVGHILPFLPNFFGSYRQKFNFFFFHSYLFLIYI